MNFCKSKQAGNFLTALILILLAAVTSSCVAPGNNYYPASSGGYGYDPYYDNNRERDRLERERDRLERERWEFERERQRQQQPVYQPPPPPARVPQPDRCPPGFSPSEVKCSPQERQRGCKDLRTPGGLGCVKR